MVWMYFNKILTMAYSLKVLDILTENVTPAADLVAAVKHLYETKLKVVNSYYLD